MLVVQSAMIQLPSYRYIATHSPLAGGVQLSALLHLLIVLCVSGSGGVQDTRIEDPGNTRHSINICTECRVYHAIEVKECS